MQNVHRKQNVALSPSVEVRAQRFGVTNAYLIRGNDKWLAVDTPVAADCADYFEWLGANIGDRSALSALILTHGHADHAGCAREVQTQWLAPVIAGRAEAPALASGRNPPLRLATPGGFFVRPLVQSERFVPITPDVAVESALDLSPYGIEGRVEQVGGHTAGSLTVIVAGHAFVGDLLIGGILGGLLFPSRPMEHYFVENACDNRRALQGVLAARPHTILPGHGGPLDPQDVDALLRKSTACSE